MENSPAIRCRGLVKDYGTLRAVNGLDLEVRAGECFGLLGPNGAGKTTTVEILEGLLPAPSGEVDTVDRDTAKRVVNTLINGGRPDFEATGRLAEFTAAVEDYRAELAAVARTRGHVATLARISARCSGVSRSGLRPNSHTACRWARPPVYRLPPVDHFVW